MQHWKKLGLVFQPDSRLYWQRSHAALPTHLHLHDDIFRIYFTSRDEHNCTYTGWFEIDITQPHNILRKSEEPVLSPGPLGFFDDHGVQTTSIVKHGDRLYLYYLGWNPGLTAPLFYTSIGLATSDDGGLTFQKYSPAPVMERSKHDPWMVSGGTVRLENGVWRMWYISGQKFELTATGAKSYYDIRYAESADGINWKREGYICLPLRENETNISRPAIILENGVYKSWFPVKKEGSGYRIGYAESPDGLNWKRLDELAGITVSAEGWDSEALDKVDIILHKGKKYMLYNGNRFGFDGIGMAVEEAR
ncbi:MAG: hypothetical protein FD123_3538 [Bacteroidetes bacterium]|nr:MAG: hypothetical protein FD123_3538 [Bacteroidota bacterium]